MIDARISEKIYKSWMQETQMEKIQQILKKIRPRGKILDVGAGCGFLEEFLPQAIAVDIDKNALKNIRGEKYVARAEHLPFHDASFDMIFCIDTIHLIKNVSDMLRVLKPRGMLVVSIFCTKYNHNEKIDFLKRKFPQLKLKKWFIVKTMQEWDAVAVFRKAFK